MIGETTRGRSLPAGCHLANCPAQKKTTAIFVVFLPLRALQLHPVALARYICAVLSLTLDALEPTLVMHALEADDGRMADMVMLGYRTQALTLAQHTCEFALLLRSQL